jgi:hypothetical protein
MLTEDREALFMFDFNVWRVISCVQKRHPKVSRLKENDTKSSACKGALKTNVINFIDTTLNVPRQRTKFKLSTEGQKGVDLIYFPEQSCLKISFCMMHYMNSN